MRMIVLFSPVDLQLKVFQNINYTKTSAQNMQDQSYTKQQSWPTLQFHSRSSTDVSVLVCAYCICLFIRQCLSVRKGKLMSEKLNCGFKLSHRERKQDLMSVVIFVQVAATHSSLDPPPSQNSLAWPILRLLGNINIDPGILESSDCILNKTYCKREFGRI